MARRWVILTPTQKTGINAKLKPVDSKVQIYTTFAPKVVYEVDNKGFADLKKYKTKITNTDPALQVALSLGLKYSEKKYGCSGCAKRRGLKGGLKMFVFDSFLEVDEDGNILPSEYVDTESK